MPSGEHTESLNSPRARAVASLRSFIERSGMRLGDRLPAESKLAAKFDVSRMTLRSALDVLEREGVVRRERNLGCFCAIEPKAEESLMSRTVVLLTDHLIASDARDFGGTSSSIVSGVIDCAGRSSMHFLRVNIDSETDKAIQQLITANPAGVIISTWKHSLEWQLEIAAELSSHDIPLVVGTESWEFKNYDMLMSDHTGGAAQLVRALVAHGKKNILRFWSVEEQTPFLQARNEGFASAAKELGLSSRPPVYMIPLAGAPIHDIQSQQEFDICVRYVTGCLVEHLNQDGGIDAIMTTADTHAMVVKEACRLLNRTDVVVTGYDNRWTSNQPCPWATGLPWITVDKNNHRIGEEMVNLLLDRINGKLPAKPQIRLVPQEIIDNSAASA